jgi:hypothetical protein
MLQEHQCYPKVEAFAADADEDFSVAVFTFFFSSSRKIAVRCNYSFEFFVKFDYFEISSFSFFQFLTVFFQGDE